MVLKRLTTAAVMAAAILLAGCSPSPDNSTDPAATGNSTATGQGTSVTITDQRGRSVDIAQPVERIASAVIPAPTIIAAVDGSWDRIVGINESLLQSNRQGIIGKIFPEATSSNVVSDRTFTPNMETILSLDPDVMIQWGDRGEDVIAPIEQAGIPTLGLEYGTQEDLETWITMFGDMLGKPDRATMLLSMMNTEEKDIRTKISQLNAPSPTALSLSYSDEKLSVSNGSDYAQHVFDIAGIINVAKDSEVQDGVVNAEQIIEWNPDIIFLSAFDEATPEDVYNDPRLADVKAVKEKKVYRAPQGVYRWQVPCAESPLFWNWVAELAYDGAFSVDLPSKTRELISKVYNYELTEDDLNLTLRTDINKGSKNYDLVTH